MKRIFYSLIAMVTLAVVATSCDSNDDVTKNYQLEVTITAPAGVSTSDFTSASVVVANEETGRQYTSDEIKDSYQFELPAGTYSVTASFRNNNGGAVASYSASKSVSLFDNSSVDLQLVESVASGLIFKEVYYNMVKPNGKTPYMRDQFFEIYNNSDEVLYLDNCILGILEGTQGKLPTAWQENGEIMKEYALGYYVVSFVGSGKDYPIQPGKSVVIAGQAQNHIAETTAMFTPEVDGAMVSPVDLSNADYEVCLMDYKPAVSIDNPSVPNMTVIYSATTQNYFNLPYTGNAIILAKLPEGVSPVDFAKDDNNFKERPDGTMAGTKYLMIPQEYVLDGLNIVNNSDKADQRVVRLRSEVDAGMLYMDAPYKGKSVRRKVEKIVNGRAVFQDTNNSSDDFLREQNPTPGIIPTVAD